MNKQSIRRFLHDPNVAKELFCAVTTINGGLTIVDAGNRASQTTFRDDNDDFYSTMVFSFFSDALEFVTHRRPAEWIEKVIVIVTTECWRGNFTIVRYRGTTKICIVNLGGVVSRARNYGYREMALLCQGAIFSPMTDLGKKISKIMEDTKDDWKSKRYA